jgi:hypothetical protein
MPRYTKNTLITAKPEATYGVDSVPTGALNAILISDQTITPLDAQNIDRDLVRGSFGASEQLVGPASVKLAYSVELAGSGTAGTAPAWGALLQACACSEGVLATPARVEYMPASTGLKSLTQYYFDDGLLHKLLGCMGDCTLTAKVGERPMLKFEFTGLDGGVVAQTDTGSFSAWKKPVAMTKANVIDIALGGAYAAGAVTGSPTPYSSTGLELKFGNQVAYTPMLSSETVDITDRDSAGSMELDLTAAQEVTLMAAVKANTSFPLSMTIGTTTGNKITIFAPNVQLVNPKKSEKNGKRLVSFDLRFVPTVTGTGNDEWRIVSL